MLTYTDDVSSVLGVIQDKYIRPPVAVDKRWI